jgi:HTH-type transcriptional regulator / antitoxin HipB
MTEKCQAGVLLRQLGSAIRSARRGFGFTQTEFSAVAGVSVNLLSQVELGKTTTQINKLLDILKAAGLQFEVRHGSAGLAFPEADQ